MKDNIIIIARHGERIDLSGKKQKSTKYDPELTQRGIELAEKIGLKIYQEYKPYIEQNGIKLISSPFTRAIETAIVLRNIMEDKIEKKRDQQDFSIIKEFGEWNYIQFYRYNPYPTLLFYKNGHEEKETKLFEEIIKSKLLLKKINYQIKSEDYNLVKFPEQKEETDKRYEKVIDKLLNDIKGKSGNIIIITAHGETVYGVGKYLLSKYDETIKKKKLILNEKEKTNYNYIKNTDSWHVPYCLSLCFKVTPEGDVFHHKNILP